MTSDERVRWKKLWGTLLCDPFTIGSGELSGSLGCRRNLMARVQVKSLIHF